MSKVRVWDPVVRVFHWSIAGGFAANALFDDAEGKLHEWTGYAILALVCLRLIWGLVGSRHARFADFPPSVGAAVGQLSDMAAGRNHAHVGHSPLGAWMIYNLLLSLIAICVSGYMMTTDAFFGVGWVEELHEILVTWAEISVILHIAGAIYESRRLGINLPKSMVTGYKEMP
ncbi:cytochrome b/b6 domain-containing protein [Defluviimonas sp. WL0002]|uniref:Cytochrome b/b6 domain-containing protein n=1 Tax=Albidovulum marisflavi TaxID=2984159 RepID=A0ABT2ZFU2_9RHOB|nr:cytochrome b/b6 domain-containing protein [Defluviimonas sp. WL0002]MCV2869959.1 cytochrome b/b6 domain-containing protein [Defluviimonas sp. WL0002]